jgi:phage gp29-like protein
MNNSSASMKTHTLTTPARLRHGSARSRFNPAPNLTPETLARMLDAFSAGELRSTALMWEVIEQRDDVLKSVATKRKKAPARFGWDIHPLEDSPEAKAHAEALQHCYEHLGCTHATDQNMTGGLELLLTQMMDAVGKRYSVHEIVWQPRPGPEPRLSATFRHVPLWHFDNTQGQLRLLQSEGQPLLLEPGSWLVNTGDGLMEACSIAYLYKHLPLRDWLVYCERNGMPGVRGVTDALPGTDAWDAAREAVRDFGAEFHALMTRDTTIEAIDLAGSGPLPYPALVERMDRAMAALWRGSSLGSVAGEGSGITLQSHETALIEREDISHLSAQLHAQVDRFVIRYLFGDDVLPRARIRLRHREAGLQAEQIADVHQLVARALPEAVGNLLKQFMKGPEALVQQPERLER